jgi:hypothetical protein
MYVRISPVKSTAYPAEIPSDGVSFRLAQLSATQGAHEIGHGRADLDRSRSRGYFAERAGESA